MGKSKGGGFEAEAKVRLPKEIADKLDKLAASQFKTRSELLRQACLEFVQREERKEKVTPSIPSHLKDHEFPVSSEQPKKPRAGSVRKGVESEANGPK